MKDTGIGISSEDLLDRERLYRGDRRSQKGLGLGLSLVRAVVQAHHGKAEVSSQPGQVGVYDYTAPAGARPCDRSAQASRHLNSERGRTSEEE